MPATDKKIGEIISHVAITVTPETAIADAIAVMAKARISCVVVAEGNKPLGIFTERDIVREASQDFSFGDRPISELMSSPVVTISDDLSILQAYDLMFTNHIRHHVVVDSDMNILGVLTQSDLINHLGLEYFVEMRKIEQVMTPSVATVAAEITIRDVLILMAEQKISCVVVTEGQTPVGILTERDIVRIVSGDADLHNVLIKEVMTSPVRSVVLGTTVHNAAMIMKQQNMRRIVVVDHAGGLKGIVTQSDIVKGLEAKYIESLKLIIREKEHIIRRTAQELLDKSVYLDSILNSSIGMAIIATDSNLTVKYFNQMAEKMFGYSSEHVIGCPVTEIHTLNNIAADRLGKGLEIVKNQGEYAFSTKMTRDGASRFYDGRVAGILGRENHLVGYVLAFDDVTRNKQAEQALRESEKTLRTLMESMPASVWWFDNDGNIEYINRCFVEQFGYALEEIPTLKDWFERAYPDPGYRAAYVAERDAAIANARKNGKPVPPREAKITCKDGTVRHVIINNYIEHHRTLAILTDITEQKIIHDQVLKMQKLESLGVLAGGIAHDFNNILTSILGNISLAQLFLDKTHKSYRPLEQAEKGSMRAVELASQLLTFAKGGQPVKKLITVPHLVGESVSLVLRGTNVKGVIDIPASLHAIEADEGQLSQAFNNLIINAIQAMPEGGMLAIHGKNVTLSEKNRFGLKGGAYVCLTFTDEGCGIPEAELGNIFDPYFTTKPGGTGLGLASTHSIICKHEGLILVTSNVGTGTTLTIYLPSAGGAPSEQRSEKVITPGEHAGGSILVMDDDEMIRHLAYEILEELGYECKTCINGEDAISVYKAALDAGSPFSAVIMDLTIPGGMGGKEAAKHLLDIDPGARLIVSSGYSNDPVMAEYNAYGFRGAVAKPYKVQQLAHVLGDLLSGVNRR